MKLSERVRRMTRPQVAQRRDNTAVRNSIKKESGSNETPSRRFTLNDRWNPKRSDTDLHTSWKRHLLVLMNAWLNFEFSRPFPTAVTRCFRHCIPYGSSRVLPFCFVLFCFFLFVFFWGKIIKLANLLSYISVKVVVRLSVEWPPSGGPSTAKLGALKRIKRITFHLFEPVRPRFPLSVSSSQCQTRNHLNQLHLHSTLWLTHSPADFPVICRLIFEVNATLRRSSDCKSWMENQFLFSFFLKRNNQRNTCCSFIHLFTESMIESIVWKRPEGRSLTLNAAGFIGADASDCRLSNRDRGGKNRCSVNLGPGSPIWRQVKSFLHPTWTDSFESIRSGAIKNFSN